MKKAILYPLDNITFMYKMIRMKLSDIIAELECYKRKSESGNDEQFPSDERHIQAIMDYYDGLEENLGCDTVFHPDFFRRWHHETRVYDAMVAAGLPKKTIDKEIKFVGYDLYPGSVTIHRGNDGSVSYSFSPKAELYLMNTLKQYCHVAPCSDGFLYKVKPATAYAHPAE